MATETRLSVRIDEKELKQLKAYAASQNKTFADWVREQLLIAAEIQEDRIGELEKRISVLEENFAA